METAKKVTCPYCGAEMVCAPYCEPKCYMCAECGSQSPEVYSFVGESNENAWKRADEAALRRAEPENRVLTLEEVKQEKAVWIEDDGCFWGDDEPHAALYAVRVNRQYSRFYPDTYFDDDEMADFNNDDYGATWRCWLRKPTEEERQNTPWEG